MIIKYYDLDKNIHLIENVKDISIYNRLPEEPIAEIETIVLEGFDLSKEITIPCKVVHYSDNGLKQLLVFGIAYICNDDGKTLEKVSMLA